MGQKAWSAKAGSTAVGFPAASPAPVVPAVQRHSCHCSTKPAQLASAAAPHGWQDTVHPGRAAPGHRCTESALATCKSPASEHHGLPAPPWCTTAAQRGNSQLCGTALISSTSPSCCFAISFACSPQSSADTWPAPWLRKHAKQCQLQHTNDIACCPFRFTARRQLMLWVGCRVSHGDPQELESPPASRRARCPVRPTVPQMCSSTRCRAAKNTAIQHSATSEIPANTTSTDLQAPAALCAIQQSHLWLVYGHAAKAKVDGRRPGVQKLLKLRRRLVALCWRVAVAHHLCHATFVINPVMCSLALGLRLLLHIWQACMTARTIGHGLCDDEKTSAPWKAWQVQPLSQQHCTCTWSGQSWGRGTRLGL